MNTRFQLPAAGSYYEKLGFSKNPFPVVPDARDYFMTLDIESLVCETLFSVRERKGFIVVTGEVGLGKSTFSRYLISQFEGDEITFALILNSFLQEENLIDEVIRDFGLTFISGGLQEKLNALNQFFLDENSAGRNCVLIVDDAQNLSFKSLEALRLLSNLETAENKLLQIILLGQTELSENLNSHELRQLKSRVVLSRELQPLSEKQLQDYLSYKFQKSQLSSISMTDKAQSLIHQYTGGNLRRTNLLLDRVILSLMAGVPAAIDEKMVRQAIADIEPLSRRQLSRWQIVGLATVLIAAAISGFMLGHKSKVTDVVESNNTMVDSTKMIPKQIDVKNSVSKTSLISTEITSNSENVSKIGLTDTQSALQAFLESQDVAGSAATVSRLLDVNVKGLDDFSYQQVLFSVSNAAIKTGPKVASFDLSTFGFEGGRLFLWRPTIEGVNLQGADLHWGQFSRQTQTLQKLLGQYGYFQGEVDGVVGAHTLRALSAFQRAAGLAETAVIDGVTHMALHHPNLFFE